MNNLVLEHKIKCNPRLLILIPIILSIYTHLWNPVGFPSLHVDEGHYLRKSLSTIQGEGLQPQDRYYAPYFGQILMGGIFGAIHYPEILDPKADLESVNNLYAVPRIIIGVFGVLDTFLIYKITELRYGRKIALIASIFFAVMPYGWLMRRIFLESIQMPLLLTSLLFAIYLKNNNNKKIDTKRLTLLLLSGAFLGLSIFTKIPIFTMIPVVAYLVYSYSQYNKIKSLIIWIVPVILIPALWPAHAMLIGDFEKWKSDVMSQTDRDSRPLLGALKTHFVNDPVFFVLGFAGLVYMTIRRDLFAILYTVPFLIFLYWIDFVSSFHVIPLLAIFSISGAKLLYDASMLIPYKKLKRGIPIISTLGLTLFGLISLTMLITIDVSTAELKAHASMITQIQNATKEGSVTLISSPLYIWMPRHVFGLVYEDRSYYSTIPIDTDMYIMIADDSVRKLIKQDNKRGIFLSSLYSGSHTVNTVTKDGVRKYDSNVFPYTNFKQNPSSKKIEIRTNY